MPESEGYLGIFNFLTEALKLMDEGEAKDLVMRARAETVRQAKNSITNLEMGMDLGHFLAQLEQRNAR